MIPALLGLPGKVATLLTRLSDARATYLDKLNISGNVASSSEVAKASVWTSGLATELDGLAPSIAAIPTTPINSIQYGTVTIGLASTSGTATITAVSTSKTALVFLGFSHSSTSGINNVFPRITLTNTTTVTATRNAAGGEVIVSFVAVEFK